MTATKATRTKYDTSSAVPEYFDMLDLQDKIKYIGLQNKFNNLKPKALRNMKCEIMKNQFDAIKEFCLRGDDKDNVRCLVCGVCWLKSGLATSIKQLMCLIPKCKSSFNTTFRYMGISVAYQRGDANPELAEYLPMISNNSTAMRKWSVRNYPDPNYVCTEIKRQREKKLMLMQVEEPALIENPDDDEKKDISLETDEPQQPQESQNYVDQVVNSQKS